MCKNAPIGNFINRATGSEKEMVLYMEAEKSPKICKFSFGAFLVLNSEKENVVLCYGLI